jgi:hypothetical protein
MKKTPKKITMYFSKWRKKWMPFTTQSPTEGQILQMKKYNYRIKP